MGKHFPLNVATVAKFVRSSLNKEKKVQDHLISSGVLVSFEYNFPLWCQPREHLHAQSQQYRQ